MCSFYSKYKVFAEYVADLGNASDGNVDSLAGVDRRTGHSQCHRIQAQPRQREREAFVNRNRLLR